VRCGCRHCGNGGGRLGAEALREHLAAVCGDDVGAFQGRPEGASWHVRGGRERQDATGPGLADAVWRATVAADDSPGWRYLVERRKVWPAGERLPASVRWLPTGAADRTGLRLPDGAAGCICYLFAGPGEADVWALQYGVVNAAGERLVSMNGVKRLSVRGSDFGSGRRVVTAWPGDDGAGVHLCEGPIDTLALLHLERLGLVDLAGAAVVGTMGVGLFKPAAVGGWTGPVWLRPDQDRAGALAAVKLGAALERRGRAWDVRRPPMPFKDWAEWCEEAAAEREGMRDA